jgi:hypothetical protein
MLPNSAVMQAVEKLNFRVTPADVASHTGLALGVVNRELANLASLTGGNIQVAGSGEIAYKFAPNFRAILLQRSLLARWQSFWQKVWDILFYLIRISFGIVLIVSIVIVVLGIAAAIVVINSSSSDSDRQSESENSHRGGEWSTFVWLGDPFSIFYPTYGYASNHDPSKRQQVKAEGDRGFLENVFSFLFGDGNPNADLEQRRYVAIANVIRNSDGVVIGEQILPYLDPVPATDSEDYMLPVLAKFNGYPAVSETGTLAYRFPDLQKVAVQQQKRNVPAYLAENLWQFSKAGASSTALSIGLGIFYLGASLFLGFLLSSPAVKLALTGLLGLINASYNFLLGYAILFLTIPAVRYFLIQFWNAKIQERNRWRQLQAELLREKPEPIRNKWQFAKKLVIAPEEIKESQLLYTTEEDLITQELRHLLAEEIY